MRAQYNSDVIPEFSMNIELTEAQSKALDEADSTPARVTDPRTRKTYVLLRLDVFDRIKEIFPEDDYVLADTYRAQVDAAMTAGWSDPAMDDYNNYDLHRKS
jgi:hypothetical protein